MSRSALLAYQLLTGASDTVTGALLLVVPGFTLRLLQLSAPPVAGVYLSFIGAFVLSVGFACLYGAFVLVANRSRVKLETVWLLTAFTRASVAIFVLTQILFSRLGPGWLTVAVADGACVLIQATGLRNGWLRDAAE